MKLTDFYKRQITVARIFGIPVRFDYRWFLVFILSVWLIAANLTRGGMWVGAFQLMPVSVTTAWILAIITTIGLFLSVLGHELSHALMGRAEGIEIEEIVLHPFGGLARLPQRARQPARGIQNRRRWTSGKFSFRADQLRIDVAGGDGRLPRLWEASCCSSARVTSCWQSSTYFPVIRSMAAACCARSSGDEQAISKKRPDSPEFAAC